jgi:diphosphomevalonate decarboxylase
MTMEGKARACANIALVKYWGKADAVLNVPAVGSISITLASLWSETQVRVIPERSSDRFVLNGVETPDQQGRVSRCLDVLRRMGGRHEALEVISHNNFPTGAGLASSASGFAALVTAAATALALPLSDRELSIVARQGSGSAARSIFGGYVEMYAGRAADGSDSFAEPLLAASDWPLEVVVAVTALEHKAVSSGSGMQRSATSSAYYPAWVATHPADLQRARNAILRRDFEQLADVTEHSCLKMHAAALASIPPLLYWNAATVECLQRITALRLAGVPVFFTIDAGPQVKAVCARGARAAVEAALGSVPGVKHLLFSPLGPGVERR